MDRVTGIGGVFFKAKDRAALGAWYRKHLGIEVTDKGWAVFKWREHKRPTKTAETVWSLFSDESAYFGRRGQRYMINYRVADLDGLLAQLRKEGVVVDERIHEDRNGRFGWITDPDGNRIELWEPAPGR